MTTIPSKFVWYDVMTSDTKAAGSFYESVMGWDTRDSGMADRSYTIFSMGPARVGGLMPIPEEARAMGARPGWMGYVGVDDVDACAARLKAAGGAVHRPPEDIPGVGRFCVVADPDGAAFILFKGNGEAQNAPVTPIQIQAFNLETAVGCARVCRERRAWQGETKQRTLVRNEEQRRQDRRARCNRVHSAVT